MLATDGPLTGLLFPVEYQDAWSFSLETQEWTDISSIMGAAPADKAPGTLMAKAGGKLYIVHAGWTSPVSAKMWSVDPAGSPWVNPESRTLNRKP